MDIVEQHLSGGVAQKLGEEPADSAQRISDPKMRRRQSDKVERLETADSLFGLVIEQSDCIAIVQPAFNKEL